MKKIYIALAALSATTGFTQTTIFSENMGTPIGNVAIPTYDTQAAPATFQNSAAFTFTGTADVRSSTPSDTYIGASAGGLIFLGATLPSKTFQIDGINTLNYTDLTLSFGQHKGTNASSNEMTVEVSDGVTWTPLTYSRPTGGGTSVWTLITPTGTIPSVANLSIRFTNPTNNTTPLSAGFRIDDIKLLGTPIALEINRTTISGLKVYPNPAKNILYVTSDNFETKEVQLFDILGKSVLNTKTVNNTVNISSLSKGVYVVKITEEGKIATRKIIID